MSRCAKIWMVVAVLFTVVNLCGAWYAAVHGETIHLGVHGVLLLVAAAALWRLTPKPVDTY